MLYDKRWDHPRAPDAVALLDAANYIEKHGWCRGAFHKASGEVCILGAIRDVTSSMEDYCSAYKRLEKYLGMPAVWWNDQVCKSKEEAITKLILFAAAP